MNALVEEVVEFLSNIALDGVAFAISEDVSGRTADLRAASVSSSLGTSNTRSLDASVLNGVEVRALGAVLGADALSVDGGSGVSLGTLLVDASLTVPDESLLLAASLDALGTDDVVSFGAADLDASAVLEFVASLAVELEALTISESVTRLALDLLANTVDELGIRVALNLEANVSSSDLTKTTGDLLAGTVDELITLVALDVARALDSGGGDGGLLANASSVDLLESRRAADTDFDGGLLADQTDSLETSGTVLDALDVVVVEVSLRAGQSGDGSGATGALRAAFLLVGYGPASGAPRVAGRARLVSGGGARASAASRLRRGGRVESSVAVGRGTRALLVVLLSEDSSQLTVLVDTRREDAD